MKSSVFIVLGTEVVLVLLTLLQCCYGAVFSKKKKKKENKLIESSYLKPEKRSWSQVVFPNPSSRWHCTTVE